MSSDRNGRAFRSGDVLRRQQQGYTGFVWGSLETHMEGSIWLGSSDSFHEAVLFEYRATVTEWVLVVILQNLGD